MPILIPHIMRWRRLEEENKKLEDEIRNMGKKYKGKLDEERKKCEEQLDNLKKEHEEMLEKELDNCKQQMRGWYEEKLKAESSSKHLVEEIKFLKEMYIEGLKLPDLERVLQQVEREDNEFHSTYNTLFENAFRPEVIAMPYLELETFSCPNCKTPHFILSFDEGTQECECPFCHKMMCLKHKCMFIECKNKH